MKQVLVLLGKARSGKDTVADFIVKEFGYTKFVFSSVLEEELKRQGKTVSKQAMALLGDELREKHGMDYIAVKLLEKVKNEKKIVFVGARSVEEVLLIKKKFPQAKLVLVEADESNRFGRRTSTESDSFEGFLERDKIDEEKKGMKKLFVLADFKLENNGSVEELSKKTRQLMYNIFK